MEIEKYPWFIHQNFRQNHRDPYGQPPPQQQRPVIVQMQAASVLATEQKTFCQVCTEFFDFLKFAAVGGLFVGYIVYTNDFQKRYFMFLRQFMRVTTENLDFDQFSLRFFGNFF